MAFDIIGAKNAGYSDTEIADYLSQQTGFDAAGARKAGYSDQEIIGHVSGSVDVGADKPAQAPKSSLLRRAVGDTAISALKGAIALPESVVGLADIVTGGMAGQAAEKVGYRPKEAKAILDTMYSPEQQEANANVQAAKGFVPTVKAAVENPSTIFHSAVESAPSMIGGAGIARGGMKLLPKLAPVVAGAMGEGAMSAGQTAEQVRQESPDGRLTATQSAIAAGSGALTGGLGIVGGKVAQRLGITDIDTFLASGAPIATKKNLLKSVFEGVISEGALEELPQSAQEQAAQNIAQGKPWDEGVAEAAASGMIVGGVMGGGGNVIGHGMAPAPQPVPSGPLSRAVSRAAAPVQGIGALVSERRGMAGPAMQAPAPVAEAQPAETPTPAAQPVTLTQEPFVPRGAAPVASISDLVGASRDRVATIPANDGIAPADGVAPTAQPIAAPITGGIANETANEVGQDERQYADGQEANADGASAQGDAAAGVQAVQRPATSEGEGGVAANVPESQQNTDAQIPSVAGLSEAGDSQVSPENATPIDADAHEAAASPHNAIPEPTPAQIEAGNYKKGHINLHGLDISIENPHGSTRKGIDPNGKSWETVMNGHYGYIKGTVGKDKDHIDVFVKPGIDQATVGEKVFVVDQIDPQTGKLDEHKVLMGYQSADEAKAGYLANYDETGPSRIGALVETTVPEFKSWLKDGNTKKEFTPTQETPHEAPPAEVVPPTQQTAAADEGPSRGILQTLAKPKKKSDASIANLAAQHGRDAVNAMVTSGYIAFPGKGMAELTKKGRAWLESNPAPLSPLETKQLAALAKNKKRSTVQESRFQELSSRQGGAIEAQVPAAAPVAVPPAPRFTPSRMASLRTLRDEIASGEAGSKIFNEGEFGGDMDVTASPSTFPDYFRNKGYTKKESLNIIDKALAGKPLTEKQDAVIDDLMEGVRRQQTERIIADRRQRFEDRARELGAVQPQEIAAVLDEIYGTIAPEDYAELLKNIKEAEDEISRAVESGDHGEAAQTVTEGQEDSGAGIEGRTEQTDDAGGWRQEVAGEGSKKVPTIGGVQKQGGQRQSTADLMDAFTPEPPSLFSIKSQPSEGQSQAYLDAIRAGKKREALRILHEAAGTKDVDASVDRDGAHSPSGPDEGAPLYDVAKNGVYPEDVYSHQGLKYYGTGEDRMDAEAYRLIKHYEAHPNTPVTVYRAVYKDEAGKINPGDWVTIVRDYAKDHGEGALNGNYKIIKKLVYARDIFTSGDSWLEWGYHPQEFKPEILKGEKALIPLEQRVANHKERGKYSTADSAPESLTLARVQSSFPTLPITEKNGVFIVTAPSGVSVRISTVGEIEFGPEQRAAAEREYGRKLRDDERPVAEFKPLDHGAIINLTEKGVGDLDHEVFHLAMSAALNPKQIKAVLSRFGSEEKAAAEYQRLKDTGAFEEKKGHLFLNAIYRFFRNLRQLIAPTAHGVMQDVASGRVWGKAHAADGGTKYAAKDQTDTPAFKKWFGNSKVVDKDGKPLVVYKGMQSASRDGKPITVISSPIGGRAGFFTSSAAVADGFAEMQGRADNPAATFPVYLSLQNPFVIDARGKTAGDIQFGDSPVFEKAMDNAEYDGVVIKNTSNEGDVYVAKSPTQIKSAIGNNGGFDPSNPDIRYSLKSAFDRHSPTELKAALTLHPKVQSLVAAAFDNGRNVTGWQKTVGTMYHLAEKLAAKGKPQFKEVFNKGQEFLNDISAFAVAAESLAPDIFPKLGTGKGIFHNLPRKDAVAIAEPLYQGTLFGGADPTHGKVFSDTELSRIFKLTDQQIDLYRQARAATDQSLDDMARSLIAKNAKQAKVDYDREMSLVEMAQDVKDSIQAKVDDMQAALDQAEKDFEEASKTLEGKELKDAQKQHLKFTHPQEAAIDLYKSLIQNIDNLSHKTETLKKRGYFPLMRFGEYTVTMKNRNGETQFFGMYESAYKAKLIESALREQHPNNTVVQSVMSKESFKLYGGMNLEALQLFAEHLGADETAAYQEYLKVGMANRSAMKRLIHRKGTAGYSEDAVRTLANFIVSNARHASTQYNLHDMRRLAAEIPEDTQGDVKDQAVKLFEYLTKPVEEAAKLRGYLFFHYLGGSLSAGIVNMTQPVMMTAPYLATKANPAKVAKHLAKASKMAFTDPAKIAGSLGTALRRAEKDGVTAPQEIHQLTAIASNKLLASNTVVNAAMKAWGGFFSVAEAFNRRVTFIASYRISRENGMSDHAAYQEAINAVTATQGIYSKVNRPNWGRGIIGAPLYTFKQFGVMYLELFNRLPAKQKALMMGILWLMAGLQGLPFAEDAEDVIDTIGQWGGYATNSKHWLDRTAKGALGDKAGSFLTGGISSVLPIDIQGRMGMHNLIPGTGFLKQSSTDKGRDIREFFGPMGGLFASLSDALTLSATGQPVRAALAASPRAIQNIAQGAEMLATGAGHDKYGRKTMEVSPQEAVAKMTGFNPSRIAEESQIKSANMQDVALFRVRKQEIVNQWAYGIANRDFGEVSAARRKLKDWREKNPDMPMTGVLESARSKAKAMKMTGKERFVKSMPAALRGRLLNEME